MTRFYGVIFSAAVAIFSLAANAQPMILRGPQMGAGAKPAAGAVNLPYTTADGSGGMWFVYNDGALRQQMNPAIFAQGGMLTIDGAGFNVMNNQGTVDARTGELILENPQIGGLAISRRILFDKDDGYVRYVDVLRNPTDQDRTATLTLQTVLNWGVQQGQIIPDARRPDQNIAWVGMTNMNRAVLEIYAGAGGKIFPTINYQNGGNVIQANYSLTIPAGKEAAVMHLHLFVPTLDAGVKFAADTRADKLTRSLPPEIRKAILNFSAAAAWMGDMEILRGDVFDVVELRGGDQLRGALRENSFKLDTFFGPLELPADRVIAMVNIGLLHPRQLLVTQDGEIFGGHLSQPAVDLALTSGQVVSIPVDQISRLGYRKRPDETKEITFDKPLILMRGGDRLAVEIGATKIPVASRYGMVDLDPASIASIVFQTEESGVHDVYLTDGSRFAALVSADALEMKLNGAGPAQTVRFPVGALLRLQVTPNNPDPDSDSPSVTLTNQDILCGGLEGSPNLQTAFDTITLDARQIERITRADAGDVQVTLWDGSVISGQMVEPAVTCRLLSGAQMNVPVSLIKEYKQPHPLPSADMIRQIDDAAAQLNADDWRQRDRAEADLVAMGPAVIGVLREARPKLAPEAQQRIDGIIKKVAGRPAKPGN